MEKVKILHCGDIHLDTPFKEFNKKIAEKSREDIKRVLENIINICNEEAVDILLVAGDFFDNQSVKKETLLFIKDVFSRLQKTRVFISPGNHDPFNEKSFYKLIEWPENMFIFTGSLERVILDKVVVHGFGFNKRYERESLFKNIEIIEDKINILVGHGDFGVNESEYNSITKEDIIKSNLDYVALGHIHSFSGINRLGKTSYAYSGCPQGRGFDEEGDKGVLIGEIGKEYVELNFKKTSLKNFYTKEIYLENEKSNIQVEEKIKENLKDNKEDFFKVVLKGNVDRELRINLNIIEENLSKEYYFIKIVDKTKIRVEKEDMDLNSTKGLFINYINSIEEDEEILNLAIDIGLRSLLSEEVDLDDY